MLAIGVLEQVDRQRRLDRQIAASQRQISRGRDAQDMATNGADFGTAEEYAMAGSSADRAVFAEVTDLFQRQILRSARGGRVWVAVSDDRHISRLDGEVAEQALNSHRRTHISMSRALLRQWPLAAFFPLTDFEGRAKRARLS